MDLIKHSELVSNKNIIKLVEDLGFSLSKNYYQSGTYNIWYNYGNLRETVILYLKYDYVKISVASTKYHIIVELFSRDVVLNDKTRTFTFLGINSLKDYILRSICNESFISNEEKGCQEGGNSL